MRLDAGGGSPELMFRPRGWPLIMALVLPAFMGVMLFVSFADDAFWVPLFVMPMWLYLVYVYVLRMAMVLEITGGELAWRTPLSSGDVKIDYIRSVRRGRGGGYGAVRIIDLADGRSVYVGEGAECDRLVRALEEHGGQFNVDV